MIGVLLKLGSWLLFFQSGLGFIPTSIINFILNVFGKSAADGAKTTVHCCVDADVVKDSGRYFVDAKPVNLFPWLVDARKEKLLWQKSDQLVGL